MEEQSLYLISILKNTNIPVDTKLDHIGKLKTYIKHHQVPETAVAASFDVVRLALSFSQLVEVGFSTLSHLIKRLLLQNQQSIIASQGHKTYQPIVDRLGDSKDRVQVRAIQALAEFWSAAPADVEGIVREKVLSGKSSRAKQAGMQWIIKMHKDAALQFRSFVPQLVDSLEDADGITRENAKIAIIELFRSASDRAKLDLTKQMDKRGVRKTIVDYLHSQIDSSNVSSSTTSRPPSQPEPDLLTHAQESGVLVRSNTFGGSLANKPPPLISANSTPAPDSAQVIAMTRAEIDAAKPIYVDSAGWLHLDKTLTSNSEPRTCRMEELAREMLPHFEGKESEHNWVQREKNILALRKITKGNAPTELTTTYLATIKTLLDGILKMVNSLRTTVSTNGCLLVQEIAQAVGTGMDPMVEILLQSLVKLCGHTKTISAENGDATISMILKNTTYHVRLLQHIWGACQDKNVRPRTYASGWLKILLNRHSHHKNTLEHGNGLDIIEKCLQKGLTDAQADVRQNMRAAYWSFQPLWPTRAEAILKALKPSAQEQLLQHHSNPKCGDFAGLSTESVGSKAPVLSRSTTSKTQSSLKEMLAKKRQAAKLERPESAQASTSPVRPVLVRPATAMATGSLSSAPLRPVRPKVAPKKPTTPTTSPVKLNKPKKPLVADPATAKKFGPKTPSIFRDHNPPFSYAEEHSPTNAAEEFTLVLPTTSAVDYFPPPRMGYPLALDGDGTTSVQPLARSPVRTRPQPTSHSTNLDDGGSTERAVGPKVHVDDPFAAPKSLGPFEYSPRAPLHSRSPVINPSDASVATTVHTPISNLAKLTSHIPSPKAPTSVYSLSPMMQSMTLDEGSESGNLHARTPILDSVYAPSKASEHAIGLPLSPSSTLVDEGKIYGDAGDMEPFGHPDDEPGPMPRRKSQAPTYEVFGKKENMRAFQEYVRQNQGVLAELPLNESTMKKVSGDFTAQRLIDSGLLRIRGKTLDAHGYRKLQALISSRLDIWDGTTKYEELVLALLDSLETSTDERIQMQILLTIRMMFQAKRKLFEPMLPKAICSILEARAPRASNEHVSAALDDSLVELYKWSNNAEACLDAVLKSIEEKESVARYLSEATHCMADILHQHQKRLSERMERRLGAVAVRGMPALNVDVRKFSFDFAMQMHMCIGEEDFWGRLAGIRQQDKTLLVYYLARAAAGETQGEGRD